MVGIDVPGEGSELRMTGQFHRDRGRRAGLDKSSGRGMAKIVETQILDLRIAAGVHESLLAVLDSLKHEIAFPGMRQFEPFSQDVSEINLERLWGKKPGEDPGFSVIWC